MSLGEASFQEASLALHLQPIGSALPGSSSKPHTREEASKKLRSEELSEAGLREGRSGLCARQLRQLGAGFNSELYPGEGA